MRDPSHVWAAEEEFIPGDVYHALKAVKGTPGVRESEKVRPVSAAAARRNSEASQGPPVPMTPSRAGRRPKEGRKWPPGESYTTASHRRAVHRAREPAGIDRWSPNQFRHSDATRIREKHGIEVARIVLGHATLATTRVCAEADLTKALEVMGRFGWAAAKTDDSRTPDPSIPAKFARILNFVFPIANPPRYNNDRSKSTRLIRTQAPASRRMPHMATPAQIAANRRNSLKSTGPKSPESKAITRQNSLKHGMSGEGTVLPASDVARVEARTARFLDEMKPRTDRGKFLVGQMALLSVRMERIGDYDLATSDYRVRHAVEKFQEDREDRAQALFDGIAAAPRPTLKKLLRMPEGVDLLIEGWLDLKAQPTRARRPTWTPADLERAAHLQGLPAEEAQDCDLAEVSEQLWAELDVEKAAEIRLKLVEAIDEQISWLEDHYEALDHDTIDLDREGATARAQFDGSLEAERARRYESEASRRYTKCRKELEEVEARHAAEEKAQRLAPNPAPPPPPKPTPRPSPPAELASSRDEEPMEYDERLIELARKFLGPDFEPLPTTMKPKPAPSPAEPAH